MKKICLIGTALILFLEGSLMLQGCKNNTPGYTGNATATTESNTTASANDTFNNGNLSNASTTTSTNINGNGLTDTNNLSQSTSSSYTGNRDTTFNNAGSSTSSTTNNNGCNLPKHKAIAHVTTHHAAVCGKRVAYRPKHKVYCGHVTKTKAKKVECNQEVATTQPEPAPAPAPEVTQPVDTNTHEKQAEFTGNVTTTTTTVTKRSKFHIGIEGGGNLNNMYLKAEDYQTSNELKVGFNAGVNFDIGMGDHSYIQLTPKYIMKGGEITATMTNPAAIVETKDKLTLHYIEMPVDYVYKFGNPGSTRFMIGVGPYVGVLANAQDKNKTTTSYVDQPEVVTEGQTSLPIGQNDQTGNLKRLDWGGNAFIGIEGASGLYLKAGGELGLVNLQESNIDGKYYNRNYNFLLNVGYLFGNKK